MADEESINKFVKDLTVVVKDYVDKHNVDRILLESLIDENTALKEENATLNKEGKQLLSDHEKCISDYIELKDKLFEKTKIVDALLALIGKIDYEKIEKFEAENKPSN